MGTGMERIRARGRVGTASMALRDESMYEGGCVSPVESTLYSWFRSFRSYSFGFVGSSCVLWLWGSSRPVYTHIPNSSMVRPFVCHLSFVYSGTMSCCCPLTAAVIHSYRLARYCVCSYIWTLDFHCVCRLLLRLACRSKMGKAQLMARCRVSCSSLECCVVPVPLWYVRTFNIGCQRSLTYASCAM